MPPSMFQSSPHRDVLEAMPDTDDSKSRLVEELQSRGRAAVGAKSWMDAKLLYEKALTVCSSDKAALLNSNLSLCENKMGNFENARKCAELATQKDPTYLKGWWRLGQALQALQRNAEALEAFQKALELEPQNKALLKEHEKLTKIVEEEKRLMSEDVVDNPMEDAPGATTTTTASAPAPPPGPVKLATTTSTTTTTTTSKPKSTSTDKNDTSTKEDADAEGVFTKSDAVRGYKIVNGKKTSYFHNELSAEARELIGDIAPKKLESAEAPVIKAAPAGASAWNKAGTWEEKDVTKWATSSMKEHILATTYTFPESSPAPGALVTVTKVSKLEGHASHALARGKKRYIYEFLCKLDWKLEGPNGLECSGSLALPDIDGTIDLGEGYEIHDFVIDSVSDNSLRPLIDRFVYRGGFHESLNESVDDWVRKFRSEY